MHWFAPTLAVLLIVMCLVYDEIVSEPDDDSGEEALPEALRSWLPELTRPPDFEQFWQETLAELASITPEVRIEYAGDQSTEDYDCFDIGYLSLGKRVVRGWLTVPMGEGPFPVAVYYHARGGNRKILRPRPGLAAVSISWRGGSEEPEPPGWDITGIEDPRKYVWRAMIAHSERVCHLVERMPGVDPERMGLVGFSMGGAIALIVGGLLGDKVKFISTTAPGPGYWFLKDGTPSGSQGTVLKLIDFLNERPDHADLVKRTVSYFEAMNFAPDVTAPTFMSVGLKDAYCTPEMTLGIYNHLRCPKRLAVFAEGGHGQGGGMEQSRELGEGFVGEVLASLPGDGA